VLDLNEVVADVEKMLHRLIGDDCGSRSVTEARLNELASGLPTAPRLSIGWPYCGR